MTKFLYIFDIDGTLADDSHRSDFLIGSPKNWDAYFNRLEHDYPIENVRLIFNALNCHEFNGYTKLVFLTGRSAKYRKQTLAWLKKHIDPKIQDEDLYMRPENDFRDDTLIKYETYGQIRSDYPEHMFLGVFEDRERVVKMWQAKGVFVFDVSQGRGNF